MKIQVINGVLVRKQHSDGTDAGFAPLSVGIYDAIGPARNGFLKIHRDNTEDLFIAFEKLESYLKLGKIKLIINSTN